MGKEIFSQTFLAQYLKDFRLQSETDIFRKMEIIDTWIAMVKLKRRNAIKEEETK